MYDVHFYTKYVYVYKARVTEMRRFVSHNIILKLYIYIYIFYEQETPPVLVISSMHSSDTLTSISKTASGVTRQQQ